MTDFKWLPIGAVIKPRIGKLLGRIKRPIAEKSESRTMVVVRPGFCNHVNGSAFGPAIDCREALRRDLEFLHRLCGKLHDGPAYGVILIVHAVDRYVDVAAALTVYRQDRIAVLGGIVGVRRFHAG